MSGIRCPLLKIIIAFLSQVTPVIDERCKQSQEPWDLIDPKHIEDLRDEMAQNGVSVWKQKRKERGLDIQ